MDNVNQILFEAIKLALAGVVGGLIGARTNDKLTRIREATARKRDFCAFLKQWRSEISMARESGSNLFGHPVIEAFQNKISAFQAEASKVKSDFSNRQTFTLLCDAVSGLSVTNLHGQNKQPREVVLETMDKLLKFVEPM